MPNTRVLIYGDSILLAAVQTLLERVPAIELVTCAPEVVVFDATKTPAQELADSFSHLTAVRLIGLDGTSQRARVIQEHTCTLAVTQDLTDLIQAR